MQCSLKTLTFNISVNIEFRAKRTVFSYHLHSENIKTFFSRQVERVEIEIQTALLRNSGKYILGTPPIIDVGIFAVEVKIGESLLHNSWRASSADYIHQVSSKSL